MLRNSLLLMMGLASVLCEAGEISVPEVRDARLEVSLVASEPVVVTPTGLAADGQGRLYLVESHTHSRGRAYDGPRNDRVLVCCSRRITTRTLGGLIESCTSWKAGAMGTSRGLGAAVCIPIAHGTVSCLARCR